MKQQSILWIALAAGLLVAAPVVIAHSNHDDTPKLRPDTCEQLADRTRYSNDLADPDIRALKDKCDAKKASEEPAENEKNR
jgi:hypothetical protein